MDRNNNCNKNNNMDKTSVQMILVLQQNGSGESKIKGIREYGEDLFEIQVVSIDTPLPLIIDDAKAYLPQDFSPWY